MPCNVNLNQLSVNAVIVLEADRDIAIDLLPNADNVLDVGSTLRRWAEGRFVTLFGDIANTTGLTAAQVPALDTSKITTGVFVDARIAASNVTQHKAALSPWAKGDLPAAVAYEDEPNTFAGNVTFSAVQTAAAQPRAKVNRATNQSITNNVATFINWDAEIFDVGALHDNVTNNSRLTVPTGGDGLWLIGVNIVFDDNVTGIRYVEIFKNSAGFGALAFDDAVANAAEDTTVLVQTIDNPVATDFYEVRVRQTSGGSLLVLGTSRFWAFKLA